MAASLVPLYLPFICETLERRGADARCTALMLRHTVHALAEKRHEVCHIAIGIHKLELLLRATQRVATFL